MLRVHSNSVLVVPPFECAWLTGEEFLLRDGKGCISFEVKGDNDVTILLKPQAGSRRWQHAASGRQLQVEGRVSSIESNYTVILGSHRNSCLKFEKDGEICCMVNNVPGARLSSSVFTKFWLNYDNGSITVGSGDPGSHAFYTWSDPDKTNTPHIRYAGLSAWDKHVAYRNIRIYPAVNPADGAGKHTDQQVPFSPVAPLLDICSDALVGCLTEHSVCAVLTLADCLSPVVDKLRGQAVEYLAREFGAVAASDPGGLCELGPQTLAEALRSDSLVCGERAVFDAVMMWAGYGTPVRDAFSVCRPLHDVELVLPLVRFPLMSDEELQDVRVHPMAARFPLLQELVDEALQARAEEGGPRSPRAPHSQQLRGGPLSVESKRHVRALSAQEVAASARFQRRHRPGCSELIYMYDGDHNGVCWFLGTSYGTQEWVNPVLAGVLQVRSSSPSCRFTDPRGLVSGNFLPNNFAGPRLEPGGQLTSWWLLDLGPTHSLVPNYYTLRHDGSTDFLRNWVLQGSNDGSGWVDLRRHIDDRRLGKPGQYASWPVVGRASAVPYRMFRVLLIGPNVEAQNPRHVCLSFFELYGYFYREAAC